SNLRVSCSPKLNHLLHWTVMLKATKQRDRRTDVAWIVAPLQHSLPNQLVVWRIFLQLGTCDLVASCYCNGACIFVKVGFVARLRIADEMKDSGLLRLGPQAFAFRIPARGNQDAHALDEQPYQQGDDDQKRPDDQQKASAERHDIQNFAKVGHPGTAALVFFSRRGSAGSGRIPSVAV